MISLHIMPEYCLNVLQITHLDIDRILKTFCALEMLKLKSSKLTVATDYIVNKLSSQMIEISLVLDSGCTGRP